MSKRQDLLSSCQSSFHHLSFSLFLPFSLTELLSPQLRFCHQSNSCMSLTIKALKETTGAWQNTHRTYSFCIIKAATEACKKPNVCLVSSRNRPFCFCRSSGPSDFHFCPLSTFSLHRHLCPCIWNLCLWCLSCLCPLWAFDLAAVRSAAHTVTDTTSPRYFFEALLSALAPHPSWKLMADGPRASERRSQVELPESELIWYEIYWNIWKSLSIFSMIHVHGVLACKNQLWFKAFSAVKDASLSAPTNTPTPRHFIAGGTQAM